MSIGELKAAVTEEWIALGRDPKKLKLSNKTEEQLEEGLEKLRAIKIGFRNLFSKNGNPNLAISILANVFGTSIEDSENKEEDE